jgi:hypothetical protein
MAEIIGENILNRGGEYNHDIQPNRMKTVTSISGGKTSAYMAVHYPTDYNVFALVRIDADYCKPKDESIVKYVSDKIGMDFIATAESDKTLYVVRDLEQMIGREIIWVTGDSFDEVCRKKKALPNLMQRFCTSEMKMMPIGDWWLKKIGEKVNMSVGFRYDEIERSFNFKTDIKLKNGKHENGRNKWKVYDWRVGLFPLIQDKITHYQVKVWSDSTNINFPLDSNCVGCFWKPYQQLRKNWQDEPLKMRWFSEIEQKLNRRFKKEMSYEKIKTIGLQQDFFFGTGSGCQAGFCTD